MVSPCINYHTILIGGKQSTHVADPDDLVGGGVRADLAGEVDVAALGDAARVDVGAEGQDRSRRICKKRSGGKSQQSITLLLRSVLWRIVCKRSQIKRDTRYATHQSSVSRSSCSFAAVSREGETPNNSLVILNIVRSLISFIQIVRVVVKLICVSR